MKKLLLASALVMGLTLGACSDDDNNSKGSEPTGGQQPGGEQPGGQQPGGEQPGGEQPGKTDAPLCDRFPNFKKVWLDAFGRNTAYYYCNEFAQAGVKERLDNALSKDGVTDDEVKDAFLTCPMDWLKTDQELYERVESYVNKCLSVCPKKGFDSACKKTEHCFMEMCIKETGVKKTCTDDPTICKTGQECVNGECRDKAPSGGEQPGGEQPGGEQPGGQQPGTESSCNSTPNFKAAVISLMNHAMTANDCEYLDSEVSTNTLGAAAAKDSLGENDVDGLLDKCLATWISSEPNHAELLQFTIDCDSNLQ